MPSLTARPQTHHPRSESNLCGPTEASNQPPSLPDRLARGDWHKIADSLGFSTEFATEIPREALGVWGIDPAEAAVFGSLWVLAAAPEYRLIQVDDPQGCAGFDALRRLIMSVRRLNPEQCVVWWWTRPETLTIATLDEHIDGRVFVRRMDIDRARPDPTSLAQLAALDIRRLAGQDLVDPGRALKRHLGEVLSQQPLTRAFFAGFTRALASLTATMEDGPADPRARHDIALATLLRLVFLYFLQVRAALNHDRRFVLRHLRAARSDGRSFYRTTLRPLFFGALNKPTNLRDAPARTLGELPFLNGGLFEPLPAETQHPTLTWPNSVWHEVIEDLLEHYQFTVEEMQGADEQRAVDPEMLGRVFEGLMFGQTRQHSGSFYTPRDVVRKLVDEAMTGYLSDKTNLEDAQLHAMLAGDSVALRADLRAELWQALDEIKILDPAVGTGAFLLEALQVLRRLRRYTAPATSEASDPLGEYRAVRTLIHDHLFGVDIQHTAVRLCELRLWLALLTTLPDIAIAQMPPLPNLSHRVCAGNSLLAPDDLLNLRNQGAPFAARDALLGDQSLRDLIAQLEDTQRKYLTTHGTPKHNVRADLHALETRLQRAMLHIRRERLAANLSNLQKLSGSRDLFGGEVELSATQRTELRTLGDELRAIDDADRALKSGQTAPLAFSYASRFSDLVARGGFDLIITNPPWVRAQHIDAAHHAVLRARYQCQRNQLWPGAKAAGIRAPFGTQVDLANLFVERSLELLRPGGRLCGLVPAKLFNSLHGAALRQQLANHTLVALEDYSDGTRQLFDATVYPAMLHVQKSAGATELTAATARKHTPMRSSRACASTRMTVWRGDRAHCWHADPTDLYAHTGQPGAPWLLAEPRVLRMFARMQEQSTPLGKIDALQPTRGVFSGANDLFLGDEAEIRALLGDDFARLSRPVLSGRDVRPWEVQTPRCILWPYDAALELCSELPESLTHYFEKHRKRLEKRSDFNPGAPLWQLFRVSAQITAPKVVWRDISPGLEAALAPADVVPLNTVYFIALADARRAAIIAALFNSAPLRAFAFALAERARGGWRRHFAWVIRLLPVPARIAAFVQGTEDPELLEFARDFGRVDGNTPGAALCQRFDEFVGACWGLSPGEIEQLRAWQRGEEAA